MSATAFDKQKNLREELAKTFKPVYQERLVPTFFIADGALTTFALPALHEPFQVFNAGALVKEGSGDEYTVTDNGSYKSIVFGVAPTNLNDITIYSYRRLV